MLPEAVRKQGERADAILAQIHGNTGQPTPAPVDAQPAPATDTQPQATAPAPAPASAAAPAPVAPQPSVDDASWEQKYRVLAGKYAAEVPRMAAELRTANSTIDTLKAKVQELEAQNTAQPAADLNGLTPQSVVEMFGEDFAKAVAAIVNPLIKGETGKVREDLGARVDETANAASVAARQAFMRDLTVLVPDWMVIDTDPQFTAYLDEVDPMLGRPRRHFFNEADATNDAPRIAQFFARFREKVPGSPAATAAAPAAPSGAAAVGDLVQPSPSRADASLPAGKKVWTQAEIRKFYTDARRGLYSPQDYARIESDIFAAQGEGRLAA